MTLTIRTTQRRENGWEVTVECQDCRKEDQEG